MNEKTLPDTELLLLEALELASRQEVSVSQRDLAHRSGLSLGMVNMLVRRFVDRGWVKLSRASPRTWAYALTPAGFDEVGSRTLSFLRKTAATIASFHERIDAFILSVRAEGIQGIVYEAEPSLAFLVRYACHRHGLDFYESPQSLPETLPADTLLRLVGPVTGQVQSSSDVSRGAHIRSVEFIPILPRNSSLPG